MKGTDPFLGGFSCPGCTTPGVYKRAVDGRLRQIL